MTPSHNFKSSPFGNSNASDRSDIENTYVDVQDVLAAKYVATDDITKAKIVVGRKGSGKTHLLKHIEIQSREKSRVCEFTPLKEDIFSGRGVRAFKGDQTPEEITIFWAELWRAAFLLAALSNFYCQIPDKRAQQAIKGVAGDVFVNKTQDAHADFIASMQETYGQIAWKPMPKKALDPIGALNEILKRYTNLHSINNDFRAKLNFKELERDVSALLHQYGHVHYIIDGLDELAWSDLTGWLDVQRGLFKCIFLLSAVGKTTQYLLTTISVRNYVFNRSTQDPHADRTDAHLIKLNWDLGAATKFLNRRLFDTKDGEFAHSDRLTGENPLAGWLGFTTRKPTSRISDETVEQYLLRHTRLSPRNIIDALNTLAAAKNDALAAGVEFTPEDFSQVVSNMARDVAKRMLVTTSEEIVATIPGIEKTLAARQEDARVQGEYIINMVADELELAISMVESEVVDRGVFNSLLELICDYSVGQVKEPQKTQICRDIEGILWRSGLIAYRSTSDSRWKFSWAEGEFGFARPSMAADRIGFHSALIDLCGLKVVEDEPIF